MSAEFDKRVDEATKALADTLKRKNRDYGDSFAKQYDRFGAPAPLIRLNDKLARLETLMLSGEQRRVQDETIEDTLQDLAGYAILTLLTLK